MQIVSIETVLWTRALKAVTMDANTQLAAIVNFLFPTNKMKGEKSTRHVNCCKASISRYAYRVHSIK